MSMWARLGRILEIYGPKFWDFEQKSTFIERVLTIGPGAKGMSIHSENRHLQHILHPFESLPRIYKYVAGNSNYFNIQEILKIM
jgi:hypothetical protein